VGYTSDPKAEDQAVWFGKVTKDWDGERSLRRSHSYHEETWYAYQANPVILFKTSKSLSPQETLQRGRQVPCHRPCTLLIPRARVARRKLVHEIGFTRVSESAQLLPMIKIVPRGGILHSGRCLMLNLCDYLDGFFSEFDEKPKTGG